MIPARLVSYGGGPYSVGELGAAGVVHEAWIQALRAALIVGDEGAELRGNGARRSFRDCVSAKSPFPAILHVVLGEKPLRLDIDAGIILHDDDVHDPRSIGCSVRKS